MSDANRIPVIRQRDLFIVQCRLNDRFTTRLLVDTGSTFSALALSYASIINLTDQPVLREELISTAQRTVVAPVIALDALQVGGATVHGVDTALVPLSPQLGVQGLLGASFLKHFRVTFEYDTDTLVRVYEQVVIIPLLWPASRRATCVAPGRQRARWDTGPSALTGRS